MPLRRPSLRIGWHDNVEIKWNLLCKWSNEFNDNYGRDPSLWFARPIFFVLKDRWPVAFLRNQRIALTSRGATSLMARLDKLCIDQLDVMEDLAYLPIALASCQVLLVLAGPTYITRCDS